MEHIGQEAAMAMNTVGVPSRVQVLGPPVPRAAVPPRAVRSAARRLGVLPMPDLTYTDGVARATAHH
jgi:hypothetical protein